MKPNLIITLPIYYTQYFKTKPSKNILVGLNWYRNAHHFLSNTIKHHYHDLISKEVKGIKFDKIKLKYKIYISRNGTDGHNIRSIMEKFFLDGLVENKVIEDDSTPKYVAGDYGTEYFLDKENPRMEIEIYEIKKER